MRLSDWDEFNTLRGSQGALWEKTMPKGLTTRINIFKARFEIAARLESITFSPEFGDNTTLAYLAGTKLLLAYSAGEALVRAEDLFRDRKSSSVSSWTISRAGLAKDLLPLAKLILDNCDSHGNLNNSTKKFLAKFCEGGNSNVRPVATALRHVHAHGGLTARSITGSVEKNDSGHAKVIEELALAFLEKCDEKFSLLSKDLAARLRIKNQF